MAFSMSERESESTLQGVQRERAVPVIVEIEYSIPR